MSRGKSKKQKSDRNAEQRSNAHEATPSKWRVWSAIAASLATAAFVVWVWYRPAEPQAAGLDVDVVSTVEIPDPDLTDMQPLVIERFRTARAALVANPQSAKAWGSFGAVCDAHFEYTCAEPCYRKAIELAPDDGQWVYLLALVRRGQGTDLKEAETLLRKAVARLPTFAPAPYRLAQLLSDQGMFAKAKVFYKRAIVLDPRMAIAHDRLGKLHLATGDTKSAIRHLENARNLVPNDRALLAALGQAYMRQGQRDKAEVMIALSRKSVETLTLRDPLYEAVSSLAMSTTFLYQRAGSLMVRGKYAKAIPELKAFAETYPDNVAVNVNLALAYIKTRKKSLAEKHFATLVRLRGELKRADAAVSPLDERLIQLDEAMVVFWAEYLEMIIASGDKVELRKAIDRFEAQAVDLPVTPGAHMAWANALAELGINDRAIKHYRDAIRLDPAFSNAYYNLGYLYEDIGRLDEAIVEYKRSAAVEPRGLGARRLRELATAPKPPDTKAADAPSSNNKGGTPR